MAPKWWLTVNAPKVVQQCLRTLFVVVWVMNVTTRMRRPHRPDRHGTRVPNRSACGPLQSDRFDFGVAVEDCRLTQQAVQPRSSRARIFQTPPQPSDSRACRCTSELPSKWRSLRSLRIVSWSRCGSAAAISTIEDAYSSGLLLNPIDRSNCANRVRSFARSRGTHGLSRHPSCWICCFRERRMARTQEGEWEGRHHFLRPVARRASSMRLRACSFSMMRLT